MAIEVFSLRRAEVSILGALFFFTSLLFSSFFVSKGDNFMSMHAKCCSVFKEKQ